MKPYFLIAVILLCSNIHGQDIDSLGYMELSRFYNEGRFKDIKGIKLPEFTAKDLKGTIYNGDTVKNGQVTFISLWFESCAPCIAEIPNLNRLYSWIKDNSTIQFFSITPDSEEQVKSAIKKYDIRFPILLASQSEIHELNFGRGFPTNMVLDKKGRVYSVLSGGGKSPGPEFEKYWMREIEKAQSDSLLDRPNNQVISTPDKSGIEFIDSLSTIQSFSDLVTYFKGKTLYIDMWASWCLPCLKEFKNQNTLVDSFLKNNKIIKLYLTIGQPHAGDVWRKLVYKYQLKGYHLMAGSKFFEDIRRKIYNNSNSIDVPRYVIIKNGEIVEINAFAPSDGNKLIKQLTEKAL